MPAVTASRYLLANNAQLIAVVPAAKIVVDEIPQGIVLPAIVVGFVGGTRRQNVAGDAVKLCGGRVQITVHATSSAERKIILGLVRRALPTTRGTVDGVVVDSISHELDGPNFKDGAMSTYYGSVDYMIKYIE